MSNREFNILFTSVGRRIELIQAFREDAARLNIRLRVHGADLTDTAPALSFCDTSHKVPRIDSDEYISTLLDICKKEQIDLLVPTIDTDLLILAQSKTEFKKAGTRVLVSEPSVIKISNDKRNTFNFFKDAGVATPETFDDYTKYNLGFPCFIKPYAGSASKDAYSVPDQQTLEDYARKIPNYIVQNKIVGEEFTVDILCDFDGRPIYITPRRRLQIRAGEVLTTEIMDDPMVVMECEKILSRLNASGPVTVQYIKDRETGVNYYIEINPRFGGGSPLSMQAGARSSAALLKMLGGEKVEADLRAHSGGAIYSRFDQNVKSNPSLQSIQSLSMLPDIVAKYNAVIFDLDDTLYNEIDYVKSGFRAVAQVAKEFEGAYEKLMAAFKAGKPAIDTLIDDAGIKDTTLNDKYVDIYRNHRPKIQLSVEAADILKTLRASGKKLGMITDGRPEGQRAKIEALGLMSLVDEVIITDELAGSTGNVMNFRKPNDIAFIIMQKRLSVTLKEMVYIGDNPSKDFGPARSLGFDAIHYVNSKGLYK